MLSSIYRLELYDMYFLSKMNTELHWTSTWLEAEFGLFFSSSNPLEWMESTAENMSFFNMCSAGKRLIKLKLKKC